MMKKLILFLILLVSVDAFALKISVSSSPVTVAIVKAVVDSNKELSFHNNAGEAMVKIVKGQVDMAVMPLFLATKLKNEGVDVYITHILFGEMLFFLNNTGKIQSMNDLKGHKIYVGKGNGPLNLFPKMLIEKAGIIDDVEMVGSTASQIAQLTASGRAKVSVLREPLVTMVMSKNEYVKKAINFQTEWQKLFDCRLIQAALVVRKDFLENHPEEVNEFYKNLETADKWVHSNPEKAAKLFSDNSRKGKFKVIRKAIKTMNPRIEIPERVEVKKFIQLLLDHHGKQMGNKMPPDDFILLPAL